MANAINQPLAGYPAPPGAKPIEKFDHYGPSSYVQYNASTGAGDVLNAADLGFGGFESVGVSWSGYSNSGNYIVQAMQTKANDVPGAGAASRITFQWFTTSAAFGAKSTEATATTNLNAEYVRVTADMV
jgi:hypothetical protein